MPRQVLVFFSLTQHTIPISFGRMPHEVAINPHASALPSVTQVIIFSLEGPLVTDVFAGVVSQVDGAEEDGRGSMEPERTGLPHALSMISEW